MTKEEARRLLRKEAAREAHFKAQLHGYQKRRHTNAQIVARYKAEHPCVVCGEDHPVCLDFHHRDTATKLYDISQMALANYSESAVYAEIAKCVILCANCHRLFHAGLIILPPEK